ncbi:MAG: hypothetical protein U5K54_27685 [Cytophagales bacterium]|nr:hypothetical protein [Cytophagales bacterium]
MSASICIGDTSGKDILAKDERKSNLYQMTYEQIKLWDCGSRVNERFPQQKKMIAGQTLLLGGCDSRS